MININENKYKDLKNNGKTFPIVKEYIADEITPASIFLNLDGEYKFLLESAANGQGRYTFLGENPEKIIMSNEEDIKIIKDNKEEKIRGNVLDILKKNIEIDYDRANTEIPFTGGAVGYIGYDCIRHIEKIPRGNEEEIKIPESIMMFCKKLAVYDHAKSTLSIIYNSDINEDYKDAIKNIDKFFMKITKERKRTNYEENISKNQFKVDEEMKKKFIEKVEKAKQYIINGDIFQVVLSNRFVKDTNMNSFEIYRRLKRKNPSPYLYYIDCKEFQIVGSSPESLVKVRSGIVETLPIAGTRPRGKTSYEDKKNEEELLKDEKEISEHLMLVDLGRNDIGKVAKKGTIELSRFKEIERYSHVMHIVSEVRGEIEKDKDAFDAFKACFPAGTVSGAPKIRAMEIIEELEDKKRELYSGAVGYFGYNGDMDVCIAIRTIVLKNKKAYIQAGAGIVYDSISENEFMETVNKAKALMEVI